MTKQIRFKDRGVWKVECCGHCLFNIRLFGMCGILEKPTYLGSSIRDDCPLEEWQDPATIKESLKVEPAVPKERPACGSCHWYQLSNQLETEIVRLTNDKHLCIQELDRFKKKYDGRVNEVMRLNDRIAQQDQELKDLGKALEDAKKYDPFVCPRRQDACISCPHTACPQRIEKAIPPKDEMELVICPKGCEGCIHGHIHKRDPDDCKNPCEGYVCAPIKKEEPTVPQMQQPAPYKNTVAGALNQAIEAEGRRIDAYAKKQVDFDMRLDALEKNKNLINVLDFQLKGMADCVDKLEKEIAAIREKVPNP